MREWGRSAGWSRFVAASFRSRLAGRDWSLFEPGQGRNLPAPTAGDDSTGSSTRRFPNPKGAALRSSDRFPGKLANRAAPLGLCLLRWTSPRATPEYRLRPGLTSGRPLGALFAPLDLSQGYAGVPAAPWADIGPPRWGFVCPAGPHPRATPEYRLRPGLT